jgi:hypothetical protein
MVVSRRLRELETWQVHTCSNSGQTVRAVGAYSNRIEIKLGHAHRKRSLSDRMVIPYQRTTTSDDVVV